MDSKIKVLIGDDSAEYGIACASSLRAAGLYVITRRKDGRTLVDAIQHDAPDVVIVDAVLPNLDAMELMRRVRSGTGKQPYFIVTSAYDSAFIEKQAMEQYNVIYIGFPVWWYDLPMPVWSFLEEYDLSGKTVIPFFSHNGSSNGAGSVSRISELAKGAKVLTEDALSIPGRSVSGSEKEVKEWAAERLKENQ